MTYKVLVIKQPDNRYIARALVLPDIVASGATEAEAVDHLRDAFAALQAHSRVVDVDLPLPDGTLDNPLLRFAGMWATDPDWDIFQEAIAAHRHDSDEPAQPA